MSKVTDVEVSAFSECFLFKSCFIRPKKAVLRGSTHPKKKVQNQTVNYLFIYSFFVLGAVFHIPNLSYGNTTLNFYEGDQLNLQFYLDTTNCPSSSSTYIVYVSDPSSKINALNPDYCAVSFQNNYCLSYYLTAY